MDISNNLRNLFHYKAPNGLIDDRGRMHMGAVKSAKNWTKAEGAVAIVALVAALVISQGTFAIVGAVALGLYAANRGMRLKNITQAVKDHLPAGSGPEYAPLSLSKPTTNSDDYVSAPGKMRKDQAQEAKATISEVTLPEPCQAKEKMALSEVKKDERIPRGQLKALEKALEERDLKDLPELDDGGPEDRVETEKSPSRLQMVVKGAVATAAAAGAAASVASVLSQFNMQHAVQDGIGYLAQFERFATPHARGLAWMAAGYASQAQDLAGEAASIATKYANKAGDTARFAYNWHGGPELAQRGTEQARGLAWTMAGHASQAQDRAEALTQMGTEQARGLAWTMAGHASQAQERAEALTQMGTEQARGLAWTIAGHASQAQKRAEPMIERAGEMVSSAGNSIGQMASDFLTGYLSDSEASREIVGAANEEALMNFLDSDMTSF